MKRTLSFGSRRETWLVVAGTGLIASTYGLVRLAYGLFLPDVQRSLGIGEEVAGLVSAGASVAYCAGALTALAVPDRARRLVLGALVTASAGSVGSALATDPTTFAAAAVVASTGAGLASPGLVTVVDRNVVRPGRARAQAWVNSGTGPGLVGAGVLALVVLPDWRLGFLVGGAAAAVTGIAVLRLDRPGAPTPVDTRSCGAGRFTALGRPTLCAALMGAASAVVWTYGRTHLVDEGASAAVSTWAWIALGIGGTATVTTAGRLATWSPQRAWASTAAGVALSVAVLTPGGAPSAVAWSACALFGWSFVATTSVLITRVRRLRPDQAGPGTALLFVTLVLGQAVGSVVWGQVADARGLTAAFALAGPVALLAAGAGVVHRRDRGSSSTSRQEC